MFRDISYISYNNRDYFRITEQNNHLFICKGFISKDEENFS